MVFANAYAEYVDRIFPLVNFSLIIWMLYEIRALKLRVKAHDEKRD